MQAPTLYTDRYNDSSAIRLTCQASNNLHRNITYHWKTDLIQPTNSTRSITLNIEDYISVTCTVTDGVSKNSITIMVPLRGSIRFPRYLPILRNHAHPSNPYLYNRSFSTYALRFASHYHFPECSLHDPHHRNYRLLCEEALLR